MSKYHGKNILKDTFLADNLAIPSDDAFDNGDNMVEIGRENLGRLVLEVYANGSITVPTADSFIIQLVGYTADTIGSAQSPFTNANAEGLVEFNAGTDENDALMYLLYNTSSQGALSFSDRDLILSIPLPDKMLHMKGYDYIGLKVLGNDNDGSSSPGNIDAFITING